MGNAWPCGSKFARIFARIHFDNTPAVQGLIRISLLPTARHVAFAEGLVPHTWKINKSLSGCSKLNNVDPRINKFCPLGEKEGWVQYEVIFRGKIDDIASVFCAL